MEVTKNRQPKRITDGYDCTCPKCKKIFYTEEIIGELVSDGSYKYHRRVVGSFKQETNSEGIPTGPVIPVCSCNNQEVCFA